MAKTLKTSKRAGKKRAPKKAAKKVARKIAVKKVVRKTAKKAAKKKAIKRKRNLDHRDADHPIEVTKHFRSGPPGYLTTWQRAHHAGQKGLFDHGIAPAKIRARKNAAKKRATKRRNPDLQAESVKNRKDFAGHFNGFSNVYAPTGTPDGLSRLGILAELVLVDGSKLAMRKQNTVFLAQDTKHKLHVVSSQAGRLIDNEPGNYGQVRRVEYIEAKPHLGEKQPIQWVHKLGEISGIRPELVITKDGQLRFVGGDYTINWRGIIN